MTDRKTLGLREPSAEAPALNKKGRGWKISEKRLDELHDRAREMRRFASPANKALAKRFADADLGRYTFKRFAVVGSAIVDFNCHNPGMAIMIDEEDADGRGLDVRRIVGVAEADVEERGLSGHVGQEDRLGQVFELGHRNVR